MEHSGRTDPDSPPGWACVAGGRIPDSDAPAFRMWTARTPALPVLIAVPHAGRAYAETLLAAMRDPVWSIARLEDRLVDRVAQAAAQETGASLLMADAPRALIDLNRAPEDIDWDMVDGAPPRTRRSQANSRSRSGLGLVPRRLAGLGEIWTRRLAHAEIESRLEQVHRPYHRTLGQALEGLRDQWGSALLIDLHSMPPLKARFPEEAVPEFVIGDRFGASCHPLLSTAASDFLRRQGRACAANRPYAGGYVLERHAQPARGIHCLQVEICRSAYLDARLAEPSARLPQVARLIAGLVRDLAPLVAQLGQAGGQAMAAE